MLTLFFVAQFAILLLYFTIMAILGLGTADWRLFAFFAVGILFFLTVTSRKTVQMDDHTLYVSVFRRIVPIPRAEIASATEWTAHRMGRSDRTVTLHFRGETPFGRSITFTPSGLGEPIPHPIIAELLAHLRQP